MPSTEADQLAKKRAAEDVQKLATEAKRAVAEDALRLFVLMQSMHVARLRRQAMHVTATATADVTATAAADVTATADADAERAAEDHRRTTFSRSPAAAHITYERFAATLGPKMLDAVLDPDQIPHDRLVKGNTHREDNFEKLGRFSKSFAAVEARR